MVIYCYNAAMTISEIYAKYRIMPGLQIHQWRVAAVAKKLADARPEKMDRNSIILAALFHDMGNIIKSDLSLFPEFREPEGLPYWEGVKSEFIAKYGIDEHQATIQIARELNLSDEVVSIIRGIGFQSLENIRDSDSWEMKIVEYADLRVAPHGVASLGDRIAEARVRYAGKHDHIPESEHRFEQLKGAAFDIERELFAGIDLRPEYITDESVAPAIEELKHFQVE